MKHIFKLPNEVIDNVLDFYNPYKKNYQLVLFDLKYRFFWFQLFSRSFRSDNRNFYKYVLSVKKKC